MVALLPDKGICHTYSFVYPFNTEIHTQVVKPMTFNSYRNENTEMNVKCLYKFQYLIPVSHSSG